MFPNSAQLSLTPKYLNLVFVPEHTRPVELAVDDVVEGAVEVFVAMEVVFAVDVVVFVLVLLVFAVEVLFADVVETAADSPVVVSPVT